MLIKKILVVGGAGYVGSTVANHLIDHGFHVTILDNLSTGYRFLLNKKAKFFKIDITNQKKLSIFFKNSHFDAVFHFAAAINVNESEKKPLKYFQNNVDGTQNLIECLIKKKIKYFIFSSTCAVYGDSKNKQVSELDPTVPISNYAKSKLFSELLIRNYARKFSIKYAILRYFNVVGADFKLRSGQVNYGSLIKNVVHNITKKKYQIKVFGKNYSTKDCTAIRDYIDVNDLSVLHILSLKKLLKSKSFILNCGYNIKYSVMDIIGFCEKIIKKKIRISFLPRKKNDISAIYSNNKLLKIYFPFWKKKFSILDSISNALAWEEKLNKINKKFLQY